MKKIFGIVLALICIGTIKVNAADYYFYKSQSPSESENYILCDGADDKCKNYTKSELEAMGAGITDEIINFGPGKSIYYYKSSATYLEPRNNNTIVTPDDSEPSTNTQNDSTTKKNETTPVTDTCVRLKEPLKFLGHIVTIFKIVIPILLIVFGVMDFFRAVTAGKDDEIKKSAKTFGLRIVAGVVIFFLPTIVSFVFSMIDSWAEFEGDFNACQKCVFRVSQCE